MMLLYHRTEAAAAILVSGFREGVGSYLTDETFKGSGSASTAGRNEVASGSTLLPVDVPEATVVEFEWVEEGNGYREFLVPAAVVNQFRSTLSEH